MTNQSELNFSNFEYLLIDLGIHSAKDRNAILNYAADLKDCLITANYTPNSEVADLERAAIEEYKRYALPSFLLFLNGTKDWEMYNTKTLLDMFNDELTKPKGANQ